MRVAILTNAVTSRLSIRISSSKRDDGIKNKNVGLVPCAQAREERSLSPLPPQKSVTNANPLKLPSSSSSSVPSTTTTSTPLIEATRSLDPLVWQRISHQDAVILVSAATLGFSFLAGDLVFWHSLRWLDTAAHFLIKNHVSIEFRDFARHAMSNTPIVLGWCGWAAAAAALLYKSVNKQASTEGSAISTGVRHFLLSLLMYLLGGGTILHGDPYLVKIIKEIFHRSRPSELSSTYAFPSGHTTSATFVVGTLLFIILPAVLQTYPTHEVNGTGSANTTQNSTDSLKLIPSQGTLENPWSRALEILKQNRKLVWILCVATTASGRVLADVHWSTDVMAGACLGTGMVAVTVLVCGISDELFSGKGRDERR